MNIWDIQDEATRIAQEAFEWEEGERLGALRWSDWEPLWTGPRLPINVAESVKEAAKRIEAAMTLSMVARKSLHDLLTETIRLRRDLDRLMEQNRELREQMNSFLEMIQARPIVSQTWLRDLSSETHRLKTPILVTVEQYADEVTARWPEVEGFGAGATETQALAALKSDIVSLFEDVQYLQETEPDRLGKPLRSIARVLADAMEKVNG